MHPNILTKTQASLLPLIKQFNSSFYLVGGTALALQLGHRRSVDFDLFIVSLPDALTIAAMKAFALGKRAKWKDYIDLFFIFKTYSFKQVVGEALTTFGSEFDEKLFREQLAYFKDLDYSEPVKYMPGLAVDNSMVKQGLTEISLS